MQHSEAVQRAQRQQLLITFGAIAVTMAYLQWDEGPAFIAVTTLIGCLVGALIYKGYVKWCSGRMLRAACAEGNQKGLVGPHELELTPAGIFEKGPFNESRAAWTAVERIVDDDQYVYIYVGPVMASVIPKAAFGSPEMASRFMDQAQALWAASKLAVAS